MSVSLDRRSEIAAPVESAGDIGRKGPDRLIAAGDIAGATRRNHIGAAVRIARNDTVSFDRAIVERRGTVQARTSLAVTPKRQQMQLARSPGGGTSTLIATGSRGKTGT